MAEIVRMDYIQIRNKFMSLNLDYIVGICFAFRFDWNIDDVLSILE